MGIFFRSEIKKNPPVEVKKDQPDASTELRAEDINIPDGRYAGVWCGYEVKFRVLDRTIIAKADIGSRGPFDVFAVIKDGKGHFRTDGK